MTKANVQGHIVIDKILSLEDGKHTYDFRVAATDLGIELRDFEGHRIFTDDVLTNVALNKVGDTFYIQLNCESRGVFACDRCLDRIAKLIQGSYNIINAAGSDPDASSETEGIRNIKLHHDNQIVLDKDVADSLMLAVPNKMLCDQNCKGLCGHCGVNLNETTCEHVGAEIEDV